MAVAEGHMLVVLGVDNLVAHAGQRAMGPGRGGRLWLNVTQWL